MNAWGPTVRARQRLDGARRWLEGSWLERVIAQLKAVDVVSWTTVFGAELLWSVLPLLILLSSLANARIDDDLSRHIGLDGAGAHIVRGLFRNSPSHDVFAIVTGLIIAFAGTVAVVSSIQLLYERTFDLDQRRWQAVPRQVAWVFVLIAVLVAQAAIAKSVRGAVGPVLVVVLRFVEATLFFWWTMHFLLSGRVPWRSLLRPAALTSFLWLALAGFSSLYFSSALISDNKEYGAIGVVFTFLSWFVLIGFVFVLGATVGAAWQERAGARPVTRTSTWWRSRKR